MRTYVTLPTLAIALLALGLASVPGLASPAHARAQRLPDVAANDNTIAAGRLAHGRLTLALVARRGLFYPDGPGTLGLPIEAFGEAGRPLRIPGPLVRVPLGTHVTATVRNDLAHDLTIRGLASSADTRTAILRVPRGATRRVSFVLDRAGTFGYYGSDRGETVDARLFADAELSGAIVVDAPHRPQVDHVFVLGLYAPVRREDGSPDFIYFLETINGRAYPATERLAYDRGRTVRWGIFNASAMAHPMHLHGFFFRLARANAYDEVTHAFFPGEAAELAWKADRAGDWMFHCHVSDHISHHAPLADMRAGRPDPALTVAKRFDLPDRPMSGMVIALRVRPRPGDRTPVAAAHPRELALAVTSHYVANAPFGLAKDAYALTGGGRTIAQTHSLGPPIVLTQGEPVAIAVTNHMHETTSVHWHGIALADSYYDGGAGMGRMTGGAMTDMGYAQRMAPPIAPGGTFVARFTPPDAGTFMYHSHLNDGWQLTGGLVGPLIVMPPGRTFDARTDHIVMISENFETAGGPLAIDGTRTPQPLSAAVGIPQRLRFADLTLAGENLLVTLSDDAHAATWTPIAKDGRDLPRPLRRSGVAISALTIGETRDFRFTPTHAGTMTIHVYDGDSDDRLVGAQRIVVAPASVAQAAVARPVRRLAKR